MSAGLSMFKRTSPHRSNALAGEFSLNLPRYAASKKLHPAQECSFFL